MMRAGPLPNDGFMREEALKALQEMIPGVIAEHRRHGQNLIIWRDGKIVEITHDEAEAEYLAEKAKWEATHPPVPDAYRYAPRDKPAQEQT